MPPALPRSLRLRLHLERGGRGDERAAPPSSRPHPRHLQPGGDGRAAGGGPGSRSAPLAGSRRASRRPRRGAPRGPEGLRNARARLRPPGPGPSGREADRSGGGKTTQDAGKADRGEKPDRPHPAARLLAQSLRLDVPCLGVRPDLALRGVRQRRGGGVGGCNVVSTDCPSGPSEILDGGRYGRLARVGDPEDVARALREALSHPLPFEDLRGRAAFFSEERAAEAWLELFRDLA